jgi:catechol-2,3-dioxygenase
MTLRRVNHVVLSVSDLSRSLEFYRDLLGLLAVAELPGSEHWPAMVFLRSATASINHHDLALIANADGPAPTTSPRPAGMFHVALEVGTLDELATVHDELSSAGVLKGAVDQGMHLSVYAVDPDGLEVEIIWRAPDDAWSYADALQRRPLDINAARARWGGQLATGSAAGAPA